MVFTPVRCDWKHACIFRSKGIRRGHSSSSGLPIRKAPFQRIYAAFINAALMTQPGRGRRNTQNARNRQKRGVRVCRSSSIRVHELQGHGAFPKSLSIAGCIITAHEWLKRWQLEIMQSYASHIFPGSRTETSLAHGRYAKTRFFT